MLCVFSDSTLLDCTTSPLTIWSIVVRGSRIGTTQLTHSLDVGFVLGCFMLLVFLHILILADTSDIFKAFRKLFVTSL